MEKADGGEGRGLALVREYVAAQAPVQSDLQMGGDREVRLAAGVSTLSEFDLERHSGLQLDWMASLNGGQLVPVQNLQAFLVKGDQVERGLEIGPFADAHGQDQYIGLRYWEGGGVGVVGAVLFEGVWYFGARLQHRSNVCQEQAYYLTGGYQAGRDPMEVGAEEFVEEIGRVLKKQVFTDQYPLDHLASNFNRAVHDTRVGIGVTYLGFQVAATAVEKKEDGILAFRPDVLRDSFGDEPGGERFFGSLTFIAWYQIPQMSPDGLFCTGVFMHMAYLARTGMFLTDSARRGR